MDYYHSGYTYHCPRSIHTIIQGLEATYIEQRLKSYKGNQAKLKYLKKIYEVDFSHFEEFNGKLNQKKKSLKKLNILYKKNRRNINTQEITQQLALNGLQSLNTDQLDILLDDQCKFIYDEIEYYNWINKKLNNLDSYFKNLFEEKKFFLEYQQLRKIQKDLRKINDYLDFQIQEFIINYFGCHTITKYQILSLVKDFFLSNVNNLIIILSGSIIIKSLNVKNDLVNEINLQQNSRKNQKKYFEMLFCYGNEKNLIAIHDFEDKYNQKYVKIYQETQKNPLLCQYVDNQIFQMSFINNHTQLLTKGAYIIRQWHMDYNNFQITEINKLDMSHSKYIINYTISNIIILNKNQNDHSHSIKILDVNFNESFSFKLNGLFDLQTIKLTKNLILNQAIKRKLITNYDKLENDY
ncbi:hypothetical protein pb186bvf_020531 [Paramecium bursaria]